MRTITLLILHCSAVMPDVESGAADIDRWHRAQGWRGGIGYHYVVRRDGTVEPGRREEVPGAHCRHHNAHSIGICY
ncbi:MAG: N-acetylmuramoyl-L-alanine amidase, partial [Bacteroidaceae bacterium]|nr:N-acetylmuramoyl-L-alanine amidase [Bacteroidaceae bacterium]